MTDTKDRAGWLAEAGALLVAHDDKARQARSRQARAEAGGKQVAVWLTPAAVKRLAAIQAHGESIAGAINRLLVESEKEPGRSRAV